jgi:hypothetical protein
MTSHKRGASDVATRSKREAEHEQERPARRAVGAQELAGLGIETAQEDGEGTHVWNGNPGSSAQDQGAVQGGAWRRARELGLI